jgi:acetyl/propionyl-CoA carboxylase alpha subunit
MLSKLVAYAPDRSTAIARLACAIDEYVIGGIKTNLKLLRRILGDPDFQSARIDTAYLDRMLASPVASASAVMDHPTTLAAAVAAVHFAAPAAPQSALAAEPAWKHAAVWEGLRR